MKSKRIKVVKRLITVVIIGGCAECNYCDGRKSGEYCKKSKRLVLPINVVVDNYGYAPDWCPLTKLKSNRPKERKGEKMFPIINPGLIKKTREKESEKPLDSGKGLIPKEGEDKIFDLLLNINRGRITVKEVYDEILGLISEREEKIKLKAAQEEMITDYASILRLRDFTEKGDNIPFLSIRDIFDKRKEDLKSKIRSISDGKRD